MLKAYAVALVLSTATPVADKQEGAQKAPVQKKEVATSTLKLKPNTSGARL